MGSTGDASVDDPAVAWYARERSALTRCGASAAAIASLAFQDEPFPLEIAWIRCEHGGVLAAIAAIADPEERAAVFHHYAITRPWLHEPPERWPDARRRAAYLRVLAGWGADSNGAAGAALKAWATSRFGLRPIWHGDRLEGLDEAERFASERTRGTVGPLSMQLDLLYTYVQDELGRRFPGQRHLRLWRGTHDADRHVVKRTGAEAIVELNCVSSFTCDREVAWEFGHRVWEVRVPMPKIVWYPGLLPGVLQGESECLVLGGDYRVRELRA